MQFYHFYRPCRPTPGVSGPTVPLARWAAHPGAGLLRPRQPGCLPRLAQARHRRSPARRGAGQVGRPALQLRAKLPLC